LFDGKPPIDDAGSVLLDPPERKNTTWSGEKSLAMSRPLGLSTQQNLGLVRNQPGYEEGMTWNMRHMKHMDGDDAGDDMAMLKKKHDMGGKPGPDDHGDDEPPHDGEDNNGEDGDDELGVDDDNDLDSVEDDDDGDDDDHDGDEDDHEDPKMMGKSHDSSAFMDDDMDDDEHHDHDEDMDDDEQGHDDDDMGDEDHDDDMDNDDHDDDMDSDAPGEDKFKFKHSRPSFEHNEGKMPSQFMKFVKKKNDEKKKGGEKEGKEDKPFLKKGKEKEKEEDMPVLKKGKSKDEKKKDGEKKEAKAFLKGKDKKEEEPKMMKKKMSDMKEKKCSSDGKPCKKCSSGMSENMLDYLPPNHKWLQKRQHSTDIASEYGKPFNEKFFDGMSEDILISPDAPKQPQPGDYGYSPQTRIGELPSNSVNEVLSALTARLKKIERSIERLS
jgi:hypothetical protein